MDPLDEEAIALARRDWDAQVAELNRITKAVFEREERAILQPKIHYKVGDTFRVPLIMETAMTAKKVKVMTADQTVAAQAETIAKLASDNAGLQEKVAFLESSVGYLETERTEMRTSYTKLDEDHENLQRTHREVAAAFEQLRQALGLLYEGSAQRQRALVSNKANRDSELYQRRNRTNWSAGQNTVQPNDQARDGQ